MGFEYMYIIDAFCEGNMQNNALIKCNRYVLFIPRFFSKTTITPHPWDGVLSFLFSLSLDIIWYVFAEGITRGMIIASATMMFSSSPPFHKNPSSYPRKTRTLGQGYGFWRVGVWVHKFYPWKTPAIHYG